MEFKEYNSKIVSADKAERKEDLKLDQFYLGFRPTVDTALKPLCNTRFIKGHKPSSQIQAFNRRMQLSHHRIRMLFITIMTKCLIQRKRSTKYDKSSPKLKQGATGTSTGRRTPRSPRSPGSAGRTPSCRQELSSSSETKRKK